MRTWITRHLPWFPTMATKGRWTPIVLCVGSIAAAGLAACGASEAPAGTRQPADTSIQLAVPANTIEPGQWVTASVTLTYFGGAQPVPSEDVVWGSSNDAVATVDRGLILAYGQGTAKIRATVGGRSASRDITVRWLPDAKLAVSVPAETVAVGVRFQSHALVRNQTRVQTRDWGSSDFRIATVDSLGNVTALAVGQVKIVATFADLRGSATLNVGPVPPGHGFGYLYSYDAPVVDDYDGAYLWDPPSSQSYSTATAPRLYLSPPYPTSAEFGWVGVGAPLPGVLLHVVPYDVGPCAAYKNERVDLHWILVGTPVAECYDRPAYRSSNRMELIALDPDAFDGTLALVRPGMASIMSNGAPIAEVDAGAGVRDYTATGGVRDSLYWFASPGRSELGNCSVAPADATPSSVMARVVCRTSQGIPAEPVIHGIGFAPDAARGNNPRVFAELDALGRVTRSSTRGLDISAVRLSDQPSMTYEISITGQRVAEFDRLPAVFLTAVSSSAPGCTMYATRPDASRALLHVTCAAPVDGLLVGAVY